MPVDNSNLETKLELRRHFLRKYHADGSRVLDCCQGRGVIWRQLRSEFKIISYWGLDLKPRRGRLRADSRKLLAERSGLREDIIDVDTYGSPWTHWLNLLPGVKKPTTVFLTDTSVANSEISRTITDALGLAGLNAPPFLLAKLRPLLAGWMLSFASRHNISIIECRAAHRCGMGVNRAIPAYFGVRIAPDHKACSHA